MLEFNSPSNVYIEGAFDAAYSTLNEANNLTMMIYFNEQKVYQVEQESAEVTGYYPKRLIIPPDTAVKITTQTTADTNPGMLVKFVGRVYA